MQMLAFYYTVLYPVLAISIIYQTWLCCRRVQLRRERVLRERVTFMLWTMANPPPQRARPSARPATDSAGRIMPAQGGRCQITRPANERGWKKHSEHRGMLLPGDYLSSGSAAGPGAQSHPDTRPSHPDAAQTVAKRTGVGTSQA